VKTENLSIIEDLCTRLIQTWETLQQWRCTRRLSFYVNDATAAASAAVTGWASSSVTSSTVTDHSIR